MTAGGCWTGCPLSALVMAAADWLEAPVVVSWCRYATPPRSLAAVPGRAQIRRRRRRRRRLSALGRHEQRQRRVTDTQPSCAGWRQEASRRDAAVCSPCQSIHRGPALSLSRSAFRLPPLPAPTAAGAPPRPSFSVPATAPAATPAASSTSASLAVAAAASSAAPAPATAPTIAPSAAAAAAPEPRTHRHRPPPPLRLGGLRRRRRRRLLRHLRRRRTSERLLLEPLAPLLLLPALHRGSCGLLHLWLWRLVYCPHRRRRRRLLGRRRVRPLLPHHLRMRAVLLR
jgi:hypothetical protein